MLKEISKMSYDEFDNARKSTETVIVPVGSIEVFGPHMPLGTDTIIAERLAARLADMIDALVAPVVPVGYTKGLMEFPGTLTVKPETLGIYLRDIVDSLKGWGFKKILFFNSHRRNVPIIDQLSFDLQEEGIKCAQVFWWQIVETNAKALMKSKTAPFGHAGEACTAVILDVAPELVKMDKAATTLQAWKSNYPEIFGYKNYGAMTDTGVIGEPGLATKEQGKEVVRVCLERIASFVRDEFAW